MIVNGNLVLSNSNIESLGNLKEVKENLFLKGCTNLKDLGKLEKAKSITLGLCPNLKSFPVNLKLEAIYDFDNDFKILSNWKGFDILQELELSNDFIEERLDFLDASGLIQNEEDLEEDEDPENYGHEYSVRNVKFETLKDILKIQSSDDLIKLGQQMGIRYDY